MRRVRSRVLCALLALAVCAATATSCSDDGVLSDAAVTSAPDTARPDAPPSTQAPDRPGTDDGAAGSDGAGDPYFPTLGNGGYDVARYELDLDIDGDDLDASVRIEAAAEVDLDTFNLDFTGFEIESVLVDGEPATHRRDGDELVVDPEPLLQAGDTFVVTVDYRGRPQPRPDRVLGRVGWQRAGSVSIVAAEPYGAHLWFPSNDHPSDKAAFRFSITVPEGMTAIANGVLVSSTERGGRTTWVWDHPDPMPTYLASIAVGDLVLGEPQEVNGIAVRHAFAPTLADVASRAFADTPAMITDLEGLFGPYPFDAYGALVVDAELGYALENQTWSLFDRSIVDGSFSSSRTMVHELAHHWFGNWVTPATWQDIWLNEGFATYAEELWLEHTVADYDIDASMRRVANGRPLGPIGDPGADGLFTSSVYWRGALTLHALRRTIGDAAFFQLLRAWLDRHGGESASTDDFVALATEVAGTDVAPLLDAWLNDPSMPPLP